MFEKILGRTASALNARDIPYMVIGRQTVLLYGEPRLTRDIDITLVVGVDRGERIIDMALGVDLKPLPPHAVDFIRKTSILPCLDEGSGIRVDFIFSQSSYEQEAISRGGEVRMGGTPGDFRLPGGRGHPQDYCGEAEGPRGY